MISTAERLLFEGPDVVMLSWNIFIIFNKTSAGLLARQARSGYPSRFSLYFNGKSTDYFVSNGFSSLSRLLLYQNEIIFGLKYFWWNLFCEKYLLTSWVSYFQTRVSGRSGPLYLSPCDISVITGYVKCLSSSRPDTPDNGLFPPWSSWSYIQQRAPVIPTQTHKYILNWSLDSVLSSEPVPETTMKYLQVSPDNDTW